MHLLLIETSSASCSVAITQNHHVWAVREQHNANHAAVLTPFIQEVLDITGLTPQNIDAIAVSGGPGSYTGLRIGVSVAKGMAYTLGCPLIALDTLQCLAVAAQEQYPSALQPLWVSMLDARRNDAYIGVYHQDLSPALSPYFCTLSEQEIQQWKNLNPNAHLYFVGNAAAKIADHLGGIKTNIHLLSARFMASLAYNAYTQKQWVDTAYYEPLYLNPPHITQPK